jgi:LAO/AO transport system kinase
MRVDVKKIRGGDHLAAARLIRLLENRDPVGIDALKSLYPHSGKALRIGVIGPAGSGKSTLVSRMISHLRRRRLRVGVLAVDPSSPFTGGALLGDRIRMQGHEADPGVFIRSMAARGETGGVGPAVHGAAVVLEAMGCEVVVIETVGVGQGEVAVAHLVHTTAVVNIPGMGDGLQAMKAGLLEAADVLVVNKADREGADELVHLLEAVAARRDCPPGEWRPPVLKTVAVQDEGIDRLIELLFEHRRHLESKGLLAKRRARGELDFFRRIVLDMASASLFRDGAELSSLRQKLAQGTIDPYSAAESLLEKRLRV